MQLYLKLKFWKDKNISNQSFLKIKIRVRLVQLRKRLQYPLQPLNTQYRPGFSHSDCNAWHKTTFPADMSQVWPAGWDIMWAELLRAGKDLQANIRLNYGYFSSHSAAVIQYISISIEGCCYWLDGTLAKQHNPHAELQSELGRRAGRKLFLSRSRSATSCGIVSNF